MSELHTCTKEDPYVEGIHERAMHPDAKEVGSCVHGCCADYKCPNCGKKFREELPE